MISIYGYCILRRGVSKVLNLTDEQFKIVKAHIGTEYTCVTDGCLCGDWEIKLKDDLYLILHRGCRKSSATPKDLRWYVDDSVYIYSKPLEDKWEDEDRYYKSLIGKANRFQTKIIREIANKTTELECGYNVYGEELKV